VGFFDVFGNLMVAFYARETHHYSTCGIVSETHFQKVTRGHHRYKRFQRNNALHRN